MTSLLAERLGEQLPRLQHLPPARVSSSGDEVVRLARSAGLILDPWQCWCLDHALSERGDGQWSAFEVAIIVARQNGKGAILEALELAALFLFDMRLIVHSAHEFKTAREHFLRMQALVKSSPELDEQVAYIHTGTGSESIGLKSGARLNFVARSRGSGRGFSGDLIVLDEAMFLPQEVIGAMLPTLSARPNPQVWYTGSAPHVDSHIMHSLLKRARSGDGGRLFLAEWGNDAGVDPLDWDAIARANPGLGIRITAEHIVTEYDAMKDLGDEFARERLGVPSAEDSGHGVFGPGLWQACCDPGSKLVGIPVVALDVGPGMAFASFAVAGLREDGLLHVEVAKHGQGTGWVVAKAKEFGEKYGTVLLDARGPAGGLVKELTEAAVPFEEIQAAEMARSCATLQEKVQNGTLRHIGQGPLDVAANGAAIKPSGDSWRWSRSASPVDITPLVSATIAAGKVVGGTSKFILLSEV